MKKFFFLLVYACVLAPFFAMEAKEGFIKILIQDNTARLSLFRLLNESKQIYDPLFFAQDPSTSYATALVNGRQLKLGEGSELRPKISRSPKGIRVEYVSKTIAVVQNVDFYRSNAGDHPDGIAIHFQIENISNGIITLGFRYILDTYLGEKSGKHFINPNGAAIIKETQIIPSLSDNYIISQDDKLSLVVQTFGEGTAGPNLLILSNWKRLYESPYEFRLNSERDFTLMPYSINDSALAMYWTPHSLKKNEKREFSFILTSKSKNSILLTGLATQRTDPFPSHQNKTYEQEIAELQAMLDNINAVIERGGETNPEEIEKWKKALERLQLNAKGNP